MHDEFMTWRPMGLIEHLMWVLGRLFTGAALRLQKRRARRVILKDTSNA